MVGQNSFPWRQEHEPFSMRSPSRSKNRPKSFAPHTTNWKEPPTSAYVILFWKLSTCTYFYIIYPIKLVLSRSYYRKCLKTRFFRFCMRSPSRSPRPSFGDFCDTSGSEGSRDSIFMKLAPQVRRMRKPRSRTCWCAKTHFPWRGSQDLLDCRKNPENSPSFRVFAQPYSPTVFSTFLCVVGSTPNRLQSIDPLILRLFLCTCCGPHLTLSKVIQ